MADQSSVPKVLILSHSFVRRLTSDLRAGFDTRTAADFGLFIFMPHHAGFLCLRPTMQAFSIYAPLRGLFIFTPHYAGFLCLRPTMGAFYIFAPLCWRFMFMPHYAGFCLATQRQDTR